MRSRIEQTELRQQIQHIASLLRRSRAKVQRISQACSLRLQSEPYGEIRDILERVVTELNQATSHTLFESAAMDLIQLASMKAIDPATAAEVELQLPAENTE